MTKEANEDVAPLREYIRTCLLDKLLPANIEMDITDEWQVNSKAIALRITFSVEPELLQEAFFPIEIQKMHDTLPMLYTRQHIHQGLAGAARFGSARAYFHLAPIFKNYSQKTTEDEDVHWLLQQAAKSAGDDSVLKAWLEPEHKEKYLMTSSKSEHEGERLYHLALLQPKRKDAIQLLEQAVQLGFHYAEVDIARRSQSPQEAFDKYIKAGEHGIADGYFNAGLMLERSQLKKPDIWTAEKLFESAAELGQMQSHLKLLERHLSEGSTAKAEERAESMSKQGDFTGLRKIGDWHRFGGNVEEAIKYYKRAGAFAGFDHAAELTQNETDREKFSSSATECQREHFQGILSYLKDTTLQRR